MGLTPKSFSRGSSGATGPRISALKKVRRDRLQTTEAEAAEYEIGDALWYLVVSAGVCGVSPAAIGHSALEHLRARFGERPNATAQDIDFRQLDAITDLHHLKLRGQEGLLREGGYLAGVFLSMNYARVMAEPVSCALPCLALCSPAWLC
jgi:hypothetical protein